MRAITGFLPHLFGEELIKSPHVHLIGIDAVVEAIRKGHIDEPHRIETTYALKVRQ
jgi:hypothetical protein